MKKIITILLLTLISSFIYSQTENISGVVNIYKEVISISNLNCKSIIELDNTVGLKKNDTIIIIQMQGSIIDTNNNSDFGNITNYNNMGVFEYKIIDSIHLSNIFINKILQNTYIINNHVQIVKTPSYNNARINGVLTSLDWNGRIGGILSIFVKDTLFIENNIEVNGKGYRGGQVIIAPCCFWDFMDYKLPNTDLKGAQKGESIALYNNNFNRARGANANGGGGGNDHNAGGGGGSNITNGGMGGCQNNIETDKTYNGGIGGKSQIDLINYCTLFMAGGGGAGHMNALDATGTNGADGGGIVIIKSKYIISNNATINNNGDSVFIVANLDAGGGGGGGGTILLDCTNDIIGTLNINLKGGNGGKTSYDGACLGPGGGGSGGALLTNNNLTNVSLNLNGGKAGYHTLRPSCGNYCATDGEIGLVLNSIDCYLEKLNFVNVNINILDTTICINDSVQIDYSNYDSIKYSDGNNQIIRYFKSPTSILVYKYDNCNENIDSIIINGKICEDNNCNILAPTGFTPNNDGNNDFFKLYPSCPISFFNLNIFNRWGENVFNTNDLNSYWDGTYKLLQQPMGVYTWVVKYRILGNNNELLKKGNITLVR
jgi:gliding motility-associated-like protein